MKCKFCGCSEKHPCAIAMRMMDDQPMIALAGQVSMFTEPCRWIAARICSAPDCVAKGYIEACAIVDAMDLEAA